MSVSVGLFPRLKLGMGLSNLLTSEVENWYLSQVEDRIDRRIYPSERIGIWLSTSASKQHDCHSQKYSLWWMWCQQYWKTSALTLFLAFREEAPLRMTLCWHCLEYMKLCVWLFYLFRELHILVGTASIPIHFQALSKVFYLLEIPFWEHCTTLSVSSLHEQWRQS